MIITELSDDVDYLRVSGADTITFLQGQVSCDMRQLRSDNVLQGALCNLKGRVIADFLVVADGDDVLLQTRQGMARRMIDTLAKYAVFSKVELSAETGSEAMRCFGLAGDEALAALTERVPTLPRQPLSVFTLGAENDRGFLIRLSGPLPRYMVWYKGSETPALLESLRADSDARDAWRAMEIEAGVVHVGAGLSETYTPQLLNYDVAGVIDFKKGCYTGQEVVARMYYRSKAKQRLYLLRADQAVTTESRVIQSLAGGDKAGEILAYSNSAAEGGSVMLAVLSTEAVAGGVPLGLSDSPDAKLRLDKLHYLEEAES